MLELGLPVLYLSELERDDNRIFVYARNNPLDAWGLGDYEGMIFFRDD